MEIYNEQMELIENPDLNQGWLEEKLRSVIHEAVEAVEEVWHYETETEYENGGRDLVKVIDVPGVEAKPAWEEETAYQVYHPYTQEELAAIEAQKNQPTQDERLLRMEEAINGMTATLGQMETSMRTMLAWLTQREA